jgi:hypothetical protein
VVGRAAGNRLHSPESANTYRLMSGLAAEGEPGTDSLARLSKVVFSTTLKELWRGRTRDSSAEALPRS